MKTYFFDSLPIIYQRIIAVVKRHSITACVCLFGFGLSLASQANNSENDLPVTLTSSYAGNVSFELAAASFLTGTPDNCTVHASATGGLTGNIPDDAIILDAFVYWSASYSANKGAPDTDVTFNNQNLHMANPYYIKGNFGADYYGGKANALSVVGATGLEAKKPYTMEDLGIFIAGNGNNKVCGDTTLGGWALVVVYEHNTLPFQVVNVFDGFMEVFNNTGQIDLSLDNFIVSPNPSGKHAHITFEGDVNLGGDKENLLFEGTYLTDTYNQVNSQFNSISNINAGSVYPTDTPGVDVDAYDISPYLVAGDTLVTTSYESGSDTVILMSEVLSVSNFPVADLAISATAAQQWQQGSQVSQRFKISNHGPSDIPAGRTEFSLTLPANLTFDGSQTQADWQCSQTAQQLDCSYNPQLNNGWEVFFDVNLLVADGIAPSTLTLAASVSHDDGSNDLQDNVADNNTLSFDVDITSAAVVDLSPSSKVAQHQNGNPLLAGQTLQYLITIDDASDLAVNNIQLSDALPDAIDQYSYQWVDSNANPTSAPANLVDNSTHLAQGDADDYLDLSGFDLAPAEVLYLLISVDIKADALRGTSLKNSANLTYGAGSANWLLESANLVLEEYDLSESSKQGSDVNGDVVSQGDAIRYVINVKDVDGLAINNLSVVDHLPAEFSDFTIVSIPAGATNHSIMGGGNHGSGLIDIRNINVAATQQAQIIFEATIDNGAADGSSIINIAQLSINGEQWQVQANELVISESIDVSTSGNKPLYFDTNDLTRLIPSTNSSTNVGANSSQVWTLNPVLQGALTLNAGEFPLNLVIEGTGANAATVDARLYYNDGSETTLATASFASASYNAGTAYNKAINLDLGSDVTIPQGASLHLEITNNANGAISINSFNGLFFSSLVLNAATVINVDDISVWDKPYSDGSAQAISDADVGDSFYVRTQVSDPFGSFDITRLDIQISKSNGDSHFNATVDASTNTAYLVHQAGNIKIYDIPITVAANESITGYWSLYFKAYEGMETGVNQVTHEHSVNFYINANLPVMTLSKTVHVISDPINLTNNPKAIPGAVLAYTVFAQNTGPGSADANSIVIQDELPDNVAFIVSHIPCAIANSGPVCFSDGASPNESGLSYQYIDLHNASDNLSFASKTNPNQFDYDPTGSGVPGELADEQIRFIRINPNGILNAVPNGSSQVPQFQFSYRVILQ